jgi:hypothetical protein
MGAEAVIENEEPEVIEAVISKKELAEKSYNDRLVKSTIIARNYDRNTLIELAETSLGFRNISIRKPGVERSTEDIALMVHDKLDAHKLEVREVARATVEAKEARQIRIADFEKRKEKSFANRILALESQVAELLKKLNQ